MGEFKGSTGIVFNSSLEIIAMPSQVKIAKVSGASYEEAIANAEFISTAFNVRQQIDFDLKELLNQRNEMLEMLKDIKDYLGSDKRAEVEQLIKQAAELCK